LKPHGFGIAAEPSRSSFRQGRDRPRPSPSRTRGPGLPLPACLTERGFPERKCRWNRPSPLTCCRI
jgi:hypothetical protein